jgi:hypothetical protein
MADETASAKATAVSAAARSASLTQARDKADEAARVS